MSKDRLSVLVMASTFPRWRGDTEPPFVLNLSDSLSKRFDVTVLVPHAPGSKTSDQWDDLKIRRFRYMWPERLEKLAYGGILPNLSRNKFLWLLVPFFFIGELIAAMRIVRSNQIDVLHAHWVIPQGLVGALVGLLTKTPLLATCHAADMYALKGRLKNRLKRWVLNRCSYFTAVSEDLLNEARSLGISDETRSSVISMGVDTSKFHPGNRDEGLRNKLGAMGPLILFVGRLSEKKGVRYLLEAMPAVLAESPNSLLAIVGDGDLRSELEEHARSLGIDEHVRFLGALPQSELPVYYATADIFVGPSINAESGDTEGLPVTFLEALASGCPVICSNVGGAREVIAHNETGLLISEKNPRAITQGIKALLTDTAFRNQIRDSGLIRVRERFDQEAVARRYSDVILQVGIVSR